MKRVWISVVFAALWSLTVGAAAPGSKRIYDLAAGKPALSPHLLGASLGFGPRGLFCARSGENLFVETATKSDQLSFGALARVAIERDILGHRWDGRWDSSVMADSTIRFDSAGRAYTLLIPRYSQLKTAVLLWSKDGCRNWRAVALTGRNATIERADGFNSRSGPPTVLSYENYGRLKGKRLWLELFAFQADELIRAFPAQLVASNSLLVVNHSGGGNSTFTTANRIVVAYPTDDTSGPGTQAVTREFNPVTHKWLTGPEELGRSLSAKGPDNHDLPAIAMLPSGKLLALINGHHAKFKVLESRGIGTGMAGWSKPVVLGGDQDDQYSYGSLNVSRSGIVNIVSRSEWRDGHYELVQFRRTADSQWQDFHHLAARTIATPNRHGYGVWHQQVATDANGAIYLGFNYVPNRLTAPEAQRFGLDPKAGARCSSDRCWYYDSPVVDPMTLVSRDDGATWQ